MDVGFVFDEYPKPMAIVRPIFKDDKCYNFQYIYVNKAFSMFLGISVHELNATTFLDHFEVGEETWFNGFGNSVKNKKNITIDGKSFDKQLKIEIFPVGKDCCGFFIHEFSFRSDDVSDFEMITEMATKDYLTGAYNRFYLREYEISACRTNVGITFFDINNLKVINDKEGHAKGDELIINLVNKINQIYPNSKVFRIGGDEFLVITNGMSRDEFNKLSLAVKEDIHENVAIGYCYYDEIIDFDDAINLVDSYMYEDKRNTKKSRGDF